jgi:hypothetical protein
MQRRSTTQDISWFIDLRRHEQLELNPPYQRRSVWNVKDRRFFLDTVFRGYPCPPLFLHKIPGTAEKTVYAVVDGKQRLQTLFQFVDDEVALASDFGDARFDGKRWSQLDPSERKVFWDYVLPVEFLSFDPNDPHEVNQAFDRLNRNMRKLEPQELRHARWDGWFLKTVETECEDASWQTLGISTKARSKRMKDAQFISELLLVAIERKQAGFDQQALDSAYANYDDPEDPELALDIDDVAEVVKSAKHYLAGMQATNGCIKAHAGTLAVFYTLWALIVLHGEELPDPADFATIFSSFKVLVDRLGDDKAAPAPTPGSAAAKALARAEAFLQASRGASTDLSPRQKRLDALRGHLEDLKA